MEEKKIIEAYQNAKKDMVDKYLITKKEAYNWLIWWVIIYALAITGVIVLVINDLSSYNRFMMISHAFLIPVFLTVGTPYFRSKNLTEARYPEFKKKKCKGVKVPFSLAKKRYLYLLPIALILALIFASSYQKGMEEARKREIYETIRQISK